MNGRTAYKLLMKRRTQVMWGRRSMFTVRIPLASMPEPPPDKSLLKELGKSRGLKGYYLRKEGDRAILTQIAKVSSGGDPRKRKDKLEGIFFVEEPVEEDGWYEWYEGTENIYDLKEWETSEEAKSVYPKPLEIHPVHGKYVEVYKAVTEWEDNYIHFSKWPDEGPLSRFAAAAHWSKTQYGQIFQDYFYLTYSVKFFYRKTARRFSASVARAIKEAKRAGIPVRAM